MLIVQSFNVHLYLVEAVHGVSKPNGVGIRQSSTVSVGGKLGLALPLHDVDPRIDGSNLKAEPFLIPDAPLKAVDVKLHDVRARGIQRIGQRPQQGDALFE